MGAEFAGVLLDEHLPLALARGLVNFDADVEINVLRIGDAGAPGFGAADAEILVWIEANGFLLVTANRATMPVHLDQHLSAGRSVPGILALRPQTSMGEIIEQLVIIWEAGRLGDFRNRITYLPL